MIVLFGALTGYSQSFDDTCFSISDGNAILYKFNKNTSVSSAMGNTGVASPEASTLNLIGDSLFVISTTTFGYVNLSSGAYTQVNSDYSEQTITGASGSVNISDIDAMTVDNQDVFWVASAGTPSFLAKMNRNGTFIENAFGANIDYLVYSGPTGFPNLIDAMAYDPIGELLYCNANDGSGDPSFNNLMVVDPSDGTGELVGNTGVGDIEGLGFDGLGNLYGTTGNSSNTASNANAFYAINKATGVATKVFNFAAGTDFETCDCIIGYRNLIKGKVFYDADSSQFYNGGDEGEPNVTVSLYNDINANGVFDLGTDVFIRSAETDVDGNYILVDAYSSGTVNYVITIDQSDLPAAYNLTTDAIEVASFSSGDNTDLYNDFGYNLPSVPKNDITGFVFNDADQGQDFDIGETGLENVTVYLYQDVNGDGIYDAGSDELLTSTTTDANGYYEFTRAFLCGTAEINIQVDRSRDDAEQDGTSMNRTSSDLDFGDKTIGMCFRNVNVPQGAEIEEAYFTVVSASSGSATTSITIYGHDANNAGSPGTGNNNLTNRNATTANVDWLMPYWSASGVQHQSPDFSNVVQEIVNRGGWSSGNRMVILSAVSSGGRAAETFDGSSVDAPILTVKYCDATISDNYLTFVETTSLPSGGSLTTDNIESASFTSGGNSDDNNNFGVYIDPAQFNTISGSVFRDNDANGSFGGSDVGENDITVNLYDDTNCNGTYDSGIDELLESQKTDGTGAYSFSPEYTLDVDLFYIVNQSSDDADEATLSLTSSDLDLAQSTVAIRFQDVAIPNAATVTSAYIELTAEATKSGSYSVTIDGIDEDNVSTFTAGQNLGSVNRTTSQQTWNGSDTWTIDNTYNSPSLVLQVQEIVNRGGWSSGNDLGFIINTGSGDRDAYTFDNNSAKAPKLYITYEGSNTLCYVLNATEGDLPTGYSLTTDNIEAAVFTSGGNTDSGNDFGYELDNSGINIISGNVFEDDNQSADYDIGEEFVESATIRLYQDDDCDGVIDVGESVVSTTNSNANGDYSFNEAYDAVETVTRRVNQSSDDADESTLNITDIDLDFAQSQVALRFNSLGIPQGASITSAYIEFTSSSNSSGTYSFDIEGVNVDNASTYSNGQNLGLLATTSAQETWSGTTAWSNNAVYATPDISAIVQEIVNRVGWSSGNSMGFLFATGTGDRDAHTYDEDALKAPRLVVQYSASPTYCYIAQLLTSSLSQGGTITTVGTHTASFSSAGNTDASNDFGVYYQPLPVDLVQFSAEWKEQSVLLKWQTSTELNNDFFEVQWSENGVDFKVIDVVDGNGTDPDGATYETLHQNPETVNFYRLRQVDFNGQFEYSNILQLTQKGAKQLSWQVYPNPFSDAIHLNTQNEESEDIEILVYSLQGKLVHQSTLNTVSGNSVERLSLESNLSKGVYMLVLSSPSHQEVIRLIKR